MNETTGSTIEGGKDSCATNAGTTGTSGGIEMNHQGDSGTIDVPNIDSPKPTASRRLPLDQTFELLRNQRRRYVLQYLEAAEGEVSLSELAEQIAAWENDKEVKQITSSERKRVYVGLYQCHLPKMDGMDVISFNKPRGLIERGENIEDVEPYLDRPESSESSSWMEPRVGLSVIGITVLPAAVLMQSQAMLPLLVAVAIVMLATLGGVMMLSR